MVSQKVTIMNAEGLHMFPAQKLARAAGHCSSNVRILYKNKDIAAKSILNILASAIRRGEEVTVVCTGPDEENDLAYMIEAIKNL